MKINTSEDTAPYSLVRFIDTASYSLVHPMVQKIR